MTDYSFWDVILNGDSPAPTRVIECVLQPVAPTTARQRLARKNELKARGTLLKALPDKHQLKFNTHKDAKTLIEAIEKRFGGNTETKKVQNTLLKQQYENFTGSSTESLDQIHDRLQKLITVSTLPNVDTLSNVVIYSFFVSQSTSPQLDNDDLKKIDADDLEDMDLKWKMAMLTVECYNCHRKEHFARECRSPKDTRRNGAAEPQRRNVPVESFTSNALVSQCDGVGGYDWSFQAEEEPTNYALMAFTSLSSSSSDNGVVFFKILYQSGYGYHVVPPPYTGTFMPPKPDLVFHNASNDVETIHTFFNVKLSPTKPDQDLSPTHKPLAPIIEDWVSDSEDDSEAKIPHNFPSFVQPTEQVKSPRPSVKHVETFILVATPKTAIPMPKSKGNIRNRKACFLCKSLTYLIKDCNFYEKKMPQTTPRNHAQRGNHTHYARMTLPNPQRHVVPTAVLTQSRLVSITTTRQVTTVVPKTNVTRPRHAKTVVTKPHSPPRRHINHSPSPKASNFPLKVTTVKAHMVNVVKGVQGKWEWKPKCLILDHVSQTTSASMTLKRFDYNDALGRSNSVMAWVTKRCSRHVTGNMSYLSNFEELNGGYVAFGGNPKGGKISGKGKTRTGKLDFDDVYFDKELKFNLFSVSQMCDKKNSVLFTDTECLVLSPEFKLSDENQVLLRVPRENNMYNVNLKNIVPYGALTCLFAKATLDESNLWHRRLGHINFKNMNKLVKVTARNQSNPSAVVQKQFDVEKAGEENVQQYVLFPVWSFGSTNPQNTDGDAAFDEKEPEFEAKKPESEVNISPSSSAQSKKHDDKTKREAKGKSPIESVTGYRYLSVEFKDFPDKSINEVNAAGNSVPAVGQIFIDSINTFSAADMPELEDITYYDDEEDVGAEADFNNLETSITEELLQIKMQKVWVLVNLPNGKRAIGHTQEEGIEYEEVFAPVARIDAIRLFLAYASFMGFMVYQMDVKSAFLYGTIEEEVYVCQPLGFEDPDYPDNVYKVDKALYGLHQAPRFWQQGDILLVQIYIDDIIFGLTNKDLCKAFEKLMKDKFQMSLIGELTFFLGLQVKQKPDGIFISQDKYVAEILRKFGLTDGKSASTPIDTKKPLLKDPDGEDVDVKPTDQ
nr:putative ribonuclease H-like domain-containing protein [Tanacetum cinerariifolium]